VAHAIDVARGLHAEVVLLTARPMIESSNSPKLAIKQEQGSEMVETGGKN
jgi:hypothetical protein